MNYDRRDEFEERQRFVSDVFHTLNQPLTALHCSLELAMRKQMTAAEYRNAIQSALESTERLMQAAGFIRQMAEADDPGDATALDVAALLRDILDEFAPVCESQEVRIEDHISTSLHVVADPVRLRKSLFFLLDFAVQSSISASCLTVEATPVNGVAVLQFGIATDSAVSFTMGSRGLELASRILAAIGGTLTSAANEDGRTITIKIPLRQEAIGAISTEL